MVRTVIIYLANIFGGGIMELLSVFVVYFSDFGDLKYVYMIDIESNMLV